MTCRILPLVIAFALFWAPTSSAQITEEVSDITGEYRVAFEEMNDLWIDTYAGDYGAYMARYTSNPTTDRERWSLVFYGFTSSTTSMASASEVRVNIDNQGIRPLTVETRTRDLDGEIMEIVETHYSESVFARIANADDVQVLIGEETFRLPDREDMRLIVQAVGNAPSPTASNDGGR